MTKAAGFRESLKNKKVKSVKEQKEELERELKKAISRISDCKKKISQYEVQIEELRITIKHLGVLNTDL